MKKNLILITLIMILTFSFYIRRVDALEYYCNLIDVNKIVYDYDNDINRILPTAEYIDSISPETQRKLHLATQVSNLCCSMAGEFVESQDESILDDYNW